MHLEGKKKDTGVTIFVEKSKKFEVERVCVFTEHPSPRISNMMRKITEATEKYCLKTVTTFDRYSQSSGTGPRWRPLASCVLLLLNNKDYKHALEDKSCACRADS